MTMQPPVPYFGAKQRIAAQIVQAFPAHHHYVEPFAGSLSVLLAKEPSALETVNDLDGDLMTFWRVLRDDPEGLERVCALTPHSRSEHALSRLRDGVSDLERARRVFVALTQGRAGQLMRTGWRSYRGGSTSMSRVLAGYSSRLAAAASRIAQVSLECRPALDVITDYGTDPDVLLYVDPPYLGTLRGTTSAYRHEMKDAERHEELLEALRAARAAVVISGYPSPLYDKALAGWDRHDMAAITTQGVTVVPGSPAGRTEVIWSNRPAHHQPTFTFDTTGAAS